MNRKTRVIPFVGFFAYVISLILLIVGFALAISTFHVFEYDVDRFVIVLPILAMWIILIQIVMSFVDKEKPVWSNVIEVAYCVLVLFAFARTLIPFLTNIATYFTVTMGDMETFAIGVPRCIAACAFMLVSSIVFVFGSFFRVALFKEKKQKNQTTKEGK